MGFWLELHCDVGKPGRDPKNILQPLCHGHSHDIPMCMSRNNREKIRRTVQSLEAEAKRRGWVRRVRDGEAIWVCPGCKD